MWVALRQLGSMPKEFVSSEEFMPKLVNGWPDSGNHAKAFGNGDNDGLKSAARAVADLSIIQVDSRFSGRFGRRLAIRTAKFDLKPTVAFRAARREKYNGGISAPKKTR